MELPASNDISSDKGEEDAQIGSSGDWARIGSSGDGARIEATGKDSVIASSGSVEYVILGEGGCAVVPYNDGERVRFAIAYVGEHGIQAGVKYQVNGEGAFTEFNDEDE
ncbi:hypothetical protein CUU54_02500 [Pectobacterium polaris]|nr:hypothetical protein [Pectobacterium polaris]PWD54875.1 hypothetical protein DF209_21475 [Pectobacterium polaris]